MRLLCGGEDEISNLPSLVKAGKLALASIFLLQQPNWRNAPSEGLFGRFSAALTQIFQALLIMRCCYINSILINYK